jgi:hypothetical protein
MKKQPLRSLPLRRAQRATLNLLPLRTVLLTAKCDAPARAPLHDSDERLALQLIEKMKAARVMANPLAGLMIESPREVIREMAESHAG